VNGSLGACIVAYALLVGIYAAGVAAANRSLPPVLKGSLVVLELAVVAQALIATIGLLRGDRPTELTVVIGYLLTSVGLLPLAASAFQDEENRWSSAAYAVASVLVAVVTIRLHQTWDVRG
jgi:hypothetical protein